VYHESGHSEPSRVYELETLGSGDLQMDHLKLFSEPGGEQFRGVPVAGKIANDLLSSTIIVGIDRDRGVLTLALTGHEVRPDGAVSIEGLMLHGNLVVPILLGDKTIHVVITTGSLFSALWPDLLHGLPPAPEPLVMGDKQIARAIAPAIRVGDFTATDVMFANFADQRVRRDAFDGTLGIDLLSRYDVLVDDDQGRLWVAPRDTDLVAHAADRISRWKRFAGCAQAGCAQITLDGSHLTVVPDPAAGPDPYEVVLEAVDAQSKGAGQPFGLVLDGEQKLDVPPAAGYRVIDASPFPPHCTHDGPCTWKIGQGR
jgi:hypothetical protein